jgi:hypothetical protein
MTNGFFAASVWPGRGILVHGGVAKASSQRPLSTLILLPVESNYGSEVFLSDQGPNLSHHGSCIVRSRGRDILLLVGGWTGSVRTNKVFAFDLEQRVWLTVQEDLKGAGRVDPPVGLSGHTVTSINGQLVCVIGREGGVKTQRKFGQMFFLHFDLGSCLYWYSEAPILPDSRSGHAACLAPPSLRGLTELVVFGGRDCGLLDVCGRWKAEDVDPLPESHGEVKKRLKLESTPLPTMHGLRHHAMLALTSSCLLVHGGRHFKATPSKNVSGVLYACVRSRRSSFSKSFKVFRNYFFQNVSRKFSLLYTI